MGTESDHEALEALVLAAGQARRFGGAKLTAPWRDGVLLDGALAAAFAAPVRAVTVVTGADPKVAKAARRYAAADGAADRLRIVHAARHAEGMAASLRVGIGSLPDDSAGAFVFLGDMPRVPTAILPLMAGALTGRRAVAPVFAGRRGNPVLFARTIFPDLLALEGDAGARRILDGLGADLLLVEAPDDGVLFDVDTPGDL